jgi:hypothetical protein
MMTMLVTKVDEMMFVDPMDQHPHLIQFLLYLRLISLVVIYFHRSYSMDEFVLFEFYHVVQFALHQHYQRWSKRFHRVLDLHCSSKPFDFSFDFRIDSNRSNHDHGDVEMDMRNHFHFD